MTNKKLLTASLIAGMAALFAIPTGIVYAGGCGIDGTNEADKISGTDDADDICGYDGNDKIQAGDGDDTVAPGDGADRTNTGDGDDVIGMEDDNAVDIVNCGDGNDTIVYLFTSGFGDPLDLVRENCENVVYVEP